MTDPSSSATMLEEGVSSDDSSVVPENTETKSLRQRRQGGGSNRSTALIAEGVPPLSDNNSATIEACETAATDNSTLVESSTKLQESTNSKITDTQLTEDIYSLIYVSGFKSGGFVFAISVAAFQSTIIGLILWDLLNDSTNPNNPLNIPPGVSTAVRVAEAFALVLAVATQNDVIEALVMLQNGYDGRLLEVKKYATCFKWFLSSLLQFLVGGGLLLSIFILVMQSSTVINMMLNFAALSFVSEIDDVAFALAKKGFISDRLQQETKHVIDLRVPTRPSSNRFRRLAFLAVLSCLMAYYGVLVHQQNSGQFTCQSIFVQFGDAFEPFMPTFSGVYDRSDNLIGERFTYVGRADDRASFGYCVDEGAWAFTFADSDLGTTGGDPCDWAALSPRTETFDITTTSDSVWKVYRVTGSSNQAVPFQRFYMMCMDCGGSSAKRGRCSDHGKCVNNKCQCEEGRYGLNCEFTAPCKEIAVDARTNIFPREESFTVSNKFELLLDDNGELVMAYDRPVYVHDHNNGEWSIMLFVGRRWIVTNTELETLFLPKNELERNITRNDIVMFMDGFHGYYSEDYLSLFISDPMDESTPTDAFTPVGLKWNQIQTNSVLKWFASAIDSTLPLETALLCATCDTFGNDCYHEQTCDVNGTCICTEGYEGELCERDVSVG